MHIYNATDISQPQEPAEREYMLTIPETQVPSKPGHPRRSADPSGNQRTAATQRAADYSCWRPTP